MANENQAAAKQNDTKRLYDTALDMFKHSRIGVGSADQKAMHCFRDAAAFLKVADKISSGQLDLESIDNNPLDEAYCPNLKKTHPVNLMSRHWGSVKKVTEVYEMVRNPGVESYEELGWGKPECNQARALFPAVIERAAALSSSKN